MKTLVEGGGGGGRIQINTGMDKARFKRRISHVPNLMRELNGCEVRRLNQLNSSV